MSTITKNYVSETNSLLSELRHQADTLSLKIEMQRKNDEALLKQIEYDIESKQQDIEHLKSKRNEIECRYHDALSQIDKNYMEELKVKSKKTKEDWNTLEQLRMKKVSQGEQINNIMSFFKKNNVCSTCTQKLEDSFVVEKMKELANTNNLDLVLELSFVKMETLTMFLQTNMLQVLLMKFL
jgi:seryl-tRNA synthetase